MWITRMILQVFNMHTTCDQEQIMPVVQYLLPYTVKFPRKTASLRPNLFLSLVMK